MFTALGFEILELKKGARERVSLPRRLLAIKECRRDAFLLVPMSDNGIQASIEE